MYKAKSLNKISLLVGGLLLASATQASVTHLTPPSLEQGNWQSINAFDDQVIWLGSSHGDVARSTDAGETWELSRPVGQVSQHPIYQIKAIDDRQAFVMSSGRGDASRLFRTRNGGYSWSQLHRGNGDEHLRCFALINDGEGWILGDTLNDEWHIVRSSNGRTWLRSRSGFSEPALPGEGAFNESGSCVRFANDTWIMGTAHASTARVMIKSRSALRFNVIDTPLSSGSNAGVTSVWPLNHRSFLVAGGNFGRADAEPELFLYENNEFTELPQAPLSGALTNLIKYQDNILVANESGIAWTADRGENWQQIYDQPVQSLSCTFADGCFALYEEQLIQLQINN
ncbi:hypothetical protein CWE09_00070 [Aliidiomarina minuta]|uniref:Photosynthesis system II assembly factor Ycf48/Hcf136-like domain-containing protein n=1 Tax=Aliidiomarina minuta TaxID=880057 RepID=A0A432W5C7_9GAMM|nr:hypothetical protein [Aliidiomarina minuta]RUO25179.1 hypothetical protein CWE09_00070 [Aliidiomarina minuta]